MHCTTALAGEKMLHSTLKIK